MSEDNLEIGVEFGFSPGKISEQERSWMLAISQRLS